jgi:hypothetical protein
MGAAARHEGVLLTKIRVTCDSKKSNISPEADSNTKRSYVMSRCRGAGAGERAGDHILME